MFPIQETDVVFLTCEIIPNREEVSRITWFREVKAKRICTYLFKNLSPCSSFQNVEKSINPEGPYDVILNNETLVINSITENLAGEYYCQVDTFLDQIVRSNKIMIKTKDRPPVGMDSKSK